MTLMPQSHHSIAGMLVQALEVASRSLGIDTMSMARFTPFSRGKIVGKAEEGAPRNRIRTQVLKKDGTKPAVGRWLLARQAAPLARLRAWGGLLGPQAVTHGAVSRWHREGGAGLGHTSRGGGAVAGLSLHSSA